MERETVQCDECEHDVYAALATRDDEYVNLWCECGNINSVPIELKQDGGPEHWGESGVEFRCYRCDTIPTVTFIVDHGLYVLSCRCTEDVRFGWGAVIPSVWKHDIDLTKWQDCMDEIWETIPEDGSVSWPEVKEQVDAPEADILAHINYLDTHNDVELTDPDADESEDEEPDTVGDSGPTRNDWANMLSEFAGMSLLAGLLIAFVGGSSTETVVIPAMVIVAAFLGSLYGFFRGLDEHEDWR